MATNIFETNNDGASGSSDLSHGMTRPRMGAFDRQAAVVVCDLSGTMVPHVTALVGAVRALFVKLQEPANRDGFDGVVIGYSHTARVIHPLAPATAIKINDADYVAGGGTNYCAALECAEREIESALARPEITQLKPVSCFFSDGLPNGADYRAVAARVRDRADVVAISFGTAATPALIEVASGPDYVIEASNMDEVRRFFAILGATMSASKKAGKGLVASGIAPWASRRR